MIRKPIILLLAILLSPAICPRAALARFSSGSHSSFHSSSHFSSGSHSSPSHSFSSGSSSHYSSGASSAHPTSSYHSTSTFGHSTSVAASHEESHATYSHPASSYAAHSMGNNYSYHDARDAQIYSLRSQLNWERYNNRPYRFSSFFGSYYTRPYSFYYHDSYNPWFWMWLMDQTTNVQANWVYNHQATMDAARYQALMNQNAALAAQVNQLQSQQQTPNPSYVPPGLPSADLMYTDDYVKTAMTPPTPVYETVLCTLGIFGACVGLLWLVFIKRWSVL